MGLLSLPLNLVRSSLSSWKFAEAVGVDHDHDDQSSTRSLGSTVTVEHAPPKATRRRCRVRFDEEQNLYCYSSTTRPEQNDYYQSRLWYSAAELKKFKVRTVSTARAFGKTDAYYWGQTFDVTTVLLTVYNACCQTLTERISSPLSTLEMQHLQYAFASERPCADCHVDSIVGLETLAIDAIYRDSQARRCQVVDAVLAMQEEQESTPDRAGCHADDLCAASQSISRVPRLYARVVAQAHYATAVMS